MERDSVTKPPAGASQAVGGIAIVAGVVVLVLTLLAVAVYTGVFVVLVPQMQ
jgi:hypothetical protein